MAVLTHIGSENVLSVLTRCRCAVMAADTVTGNGSMIEGRRQPSVAGMTGLTVITTRNMRCVLTRRGGTIVTTEAGADHFSMIDPEGRYPGGIAVTGLAQV